MLTREGVRRDRPADGPGDPVPQDVQDLAGRADRAWQAARAGHSGTPARLGCSRTSSAATSPRKSRARKWSGISLTYSPGRDGFTWQPLSTARRVWSSAGLWTRITRRRSSRARSDGGRYIDLPEGAVFHSDRGSNYTSAEFAGELRTLGIRQSVGRTSICYYNALAESFNGALKVERVHRTIYATRQQAREDIARYIELRCNRKRLHSALGYRIPQEVMDEYLEMKAAA